MQPPGWERMSAAEKVEYARKRVIEIDRAAHGLRGSSMTMPGSAPVATGQPAARGLPSMY